MQGLKRVDAEQSLIAINLRMKTLLDKYFINWIVFSFCLCETLLQIHMKLGIQVKYFFSHSAFIIIEF